MRYVLAFDMNGTLLSTAAMDPFFEQALGAPSARREWFDQMIELAMAATVTGYYTDFATLGRAALEMTAARRGVTLSEDQMTAVLLRMRRLPPFPDVIPALDQLQHDKVRMAVLTNSPLAGAEESLSMAGILGYFEQVLSVEMVQRFKPAADVYRAAATKLKIAPAELMLVAAHSWDTTGAIRAGCNAAFLRRPGEVLNPMDPTPEIVVNDLNELVLQLRRAKAA